MGGEPTKDQKEENENGNKVTYEEKIEDTHTTYNFLGYKTSERKKTITKTQSAPASLFQPSSSATGEPPTQALKY